MLPVLWATRAEVKDKIQEIQEKGEQTVIQHLAQRGENPAAPAGTIIKWNFNRDRTRAILQQLAGDRKLQTTFTNLIGNTRFKAVMEGKLRHTMCPKCQAIDSWEHCMACYKVEVDTMKEGKQWLLHVEKVMKEIAIDTPAT